MKRPAIIVLALAIVAAVVGAVVVFAFPRKAEVRTGTRFVCTYGESLGSDVRTLRVPEDQAGNYSVTTKTLTCSRHQQAEELYRQAQEALKKGDAKGAEKLLAKVVALDSGFKQAGSQMTSLKSGKKPPADGDTGGGSKTPTSTPVDNKPPADSPAMDGYRWLVPDTIAGFTAQTAVAEALAITRTYTPGDKSRYDQLVIMVEQFGSEKAAKEYVAADAPTVYPSGKKVTQSGLSGWFGVNGSGFAAMSLVKGELVVTYELHATKAKPASLESDLRAISGGILK